ncbi:MAG: polyhydroxyalkanoate synthase [Myxococcota bacterium]|jgi:polyhydroxyalkanoate synthase
MTNPAKSGRGLKRLLNLATLRRRKKPPVGVTPADVVHRENKWRLLRYEPRPTGNAYSTPILMIPSLINRHYVLDLTPGKSLVEWLVAQGHPVFMIDWGTPGPEDRYLTFDDICDGYIGRALRIAAASSPRGQAHVLGYCLGGTLAAIHGAARPERMASLLALAAPVSFGDDCMLEAWTRSPGFDVDAVVDATGNVPWRLLQASFHMLRPTLTLSKLVTVLDRAWDDRFLDGFAAIETWGSDNVSFPGEAYRRYIKELYQGNRLITGDFVLSDTPVDLANIRCPTLAITFEHDSIVPADSAGVLIEAVGAEDKQRIHLRGGHVGAVVSRSAAKSLWPTMSAWWSARDTGASHQVTSSNESKGTVATPASSAQAASLESRTA